MDLDDRLERRPGPLDEFDNLVRHQQRRKASRRMYVPDSRRGSIFYTDSIFDKNHPDHQRLTWDPMLDFLGDHDGLEVF